MFSAKDIFLTKRAASGYTIAKSLRFRSSASAYLSRTPASAGSLTTWTWSGWVKRGAISSSSTYVLFSGGTGATATTNWIGFVNDSLAFSVADGTYYLASTPVYRDPSAWYHIIAVYDSSNATASNRIKLYVNGVQITAFSTATYPTPSYAGYINGANGNYTGVRAGYSDRYFDGYLSEINFIDGQALTPSDFGQTDTATGVWMPKAYTGTYGTNGFYLKFADASAATAAAIGKDSSPNGNNWTPFNISVSAGVNYDSMYDTPTNYDNGVTGAGNYCVLNPLDTGGTAPSAANLQLTAGAAERGVRSTFAIPTSGLWYGEATVGTNQSGATDIGFGFAASTVSLTANPFGLANVWGLYGVSTTSITRNGATTLAGAGAALTSGEILQFAIDLTNNKGWIGRGNVWFNGTTGTNGDPATGANPTFTFSSPPVLFPWVHCYSSTIDINLGQRPFTYTPPTGFKALNTQNLPTPTIGATSSTLANKYFDVLTYTGTGGSQSLTGLNFQPDFAWVKARSAAAGHVLQDAVRGVTQSNTLATEATGAEGAYGQYGYVSAFGASGITVAAGSTSAENINFSSRTYVAWNWKANGSGTTNYQPSGATIPCTVSANVTAGFSVVTYTGTGANATVGHGLGVAPKMIIARGRSSGTAGYNWRVYHSSLTSASYYLEINQTTAQQSDNTVWNGSSPTFNSTVFSLGSSGNVNQSTQTYVAYCFAEVAGYSRFGSYTGNGSADGPFIFTGFRPKYIMVKRTDAAGASWIILDSARVTYNADGAFLSADTSSAENTGYDADFLANGWKIRNTSTNNNASGGTYIYAAFAETPFSYSRAR